MIAEKAIHILPKVQVFQRKIYLSAKADKSESLEIYTIKSIEKMFLALHGTVFKK